MSWKECKNRVVDILNDVHGIGKVYDHNVWCATWEDFINKMKINGKINGWMISRKKTPKYILAQGGRDTRVHLFVITGVYGLKEEDNTETIFQELIEDIVNKFDSYDQLNATAFTSSPVIGAPRLISGIQVETVEHRSFKTVLCHYCELYLYVQEFGY